MISPRRQVRCSARRTRRRHRVAYLKLGIANPRRLPITYDEEVQGARQELARGDIGPAKVRRSFLLRDFDYARMFLIHARLMSDLRTWAKTADVGFVDLIKVLDDDRDVLVSYVHLSPEGNRKIAAALASEILRELPGEAEHPTTNHAVSVTTPER